MRTTRLDPPNCPEEHVHEEFLCPDCASVVEVEWRDWTDTTNGPAEIVRIRCANRLWFLMLAEDLRSRTDQ